MVNRENWKMTKKYLLYRQARQRSPHTIALDKSALRHLLEWADDRSFYNADRLGSFQVYLASRELSYSQRQRVGIIARQFFEWMRRTNARRSARLDDLWLESLIPIGRDDMAGSQDPYTLDEIRQLCAVQPAGLVEQRTQATSALMFVSGIRPGAAVTLPIQAVDLAAGEVRQWPELGVKTKNGKRATTFMLPIGDLLAVVGQWDAMVRVHLGPDDLWYAHISLDGFELVGSAQRAGNREQNLRVYLARLCELAGVRYRRPHEIRHGHATWALTHCSDVADYKAVSVNMMHSSITVTDHVYANLRLAEIKARIESIGKVGGVA